MTRGCMNICSAKILAWYDTNKRSLPWRDEVSVYRTLVSEFMLQQTRVETVKPYFARFLTSFPTLESLAKAPIEEVLQHWKGLGYYSRAHNLHTSAKMLTEMDSFPKTLIELRTLPGVGEYLAGAIASIALGMDVAAVDGNHHRVFSRLFCESGSRKKIWEHARGMIPKGRAGDFNQALMDIGSGICRAKNPHCSHCPMTEHCQAYQTQTIEQYPPKKKKRVIPERTIYSGLIIDKNGAFLVVQRPDKGLYRGLFEFPSFFTESKTGFTESFQNEFSIPISIKTSMGSVDHRLTHMLLHNHLYLCAIEEEPTVLACYASLRWISSPDEAPLSTLAQKVWALSSQKQQLSLF